MHQQARSLLSHVGEHGAIDAQGAKHIGVEDLLNLLHGVCLEGAPGEDTRIVHDHVQLVGFLKQRINGSSHRRVICHVHLERLDRT